MSMRYKGGVISATAPVTTTSKGIWTISQQMQAAGGSVWPTKPGAPTIGTASVASGTSVSVAFTAPACTGYPSGGITGYRVLSTPGCFSNTGASSPIVVSGLTTGTSYTFKAQAQNANGYGPLSAASNSAIPALVVGQQAYTTAGTYSWVAPSGVTSVSVVAVGTGGSQRSGIVAANGGGGGGAGLGYKNNYAVTPGYSYCVVVGALATSTTNGQNSYFVSTGVVKGGGGASQPNPTTRAVGGTFTGDGGGNGGCGGTGDGCTGPVFGAGGGAGGYSGAGGIGGNAGGNNGTAGAGGGGGGGYGQNGNECGAAIGGGGVGILGQGSSGASATSASKNGKGGSGGTNGTPGGGGTYGGGTGGNVQSPGAVRIIWPGNTRSFPSTCTGDL